MSDDIVTRLRDLCVTNSQLWEVDVVGAMDEAADEIEELRRQVKIWKNLSLDLTIDGAMAELTEGLRYE